MLHVFLINEGIKFVPDIVQNEIQRECLNIFTAVRYNATFISEFFGFHSDSGHRTVELEFWKHTQTSGFWSHHSTKP